MSGLMPQWLDDFLIHIRVARYQFPEGLSADFLIIAFLWRTVAAVTTSIDSYKMLLLAINLSGLFEMLAHFLDLA